MAIKLYSKATHALRWLLLRRLPTCKEMVPLMSESLERRLSLRERVLMKLHLWVCAWCAWYLEHLHLIREAIHLRASETRDNESASSAALSSEARERIKLALKR
jgi:hypothetical protein